MEPDDKAFFLGFYEEYKNFMYYIAQKYAPAQPDCDDLVQEAVLRLMGNCSALKMLDRCKAVKYIVLTIRSAYLDQERRRQKDNLLLLEDNMLEFLMLEQLVAADAEHKHNTMLAVDQLKETLPARDWMVLEGKYIQELSQEELAAQIGVAPDSVRMILHRAKQKARQILQQHAGGED